MAKTATLPADDSTVAGRLRLARERAGFSSIRAAAQAFGWNENTYKSHEQGVRQSEGLKEKHARKYARAFKVSLAWLTLGIGVMDSRLTPEGQQLDAAERALLQTFRAIRDESDRDD